MDRKKSTFQLTAIVLLILKEIMNASSLICLQCNDVVQPRHCHVIDYCKDNEVCFVEKYTAKDGVRYNTGCMPSNTCNHRNLTKTSLCTSCCDGDFCNANGCGTPGYPMNRGPICLNCQQETDAKNCYKIDYCQEDEVCHIRKEMEFGDSLFATGCSKIYRCPSIVSRPDMLKNLSSSNHFYNATLPNFPTNHPLSTKNVLGTNHVNKQSSRSTASHSSFTSTQSTPRQTPKIDLITSTPKVKVTGVIIVGKKRDTNKQKRQLECEQCCVGDLCNVVCDERGKFYTYAPETTTPTSTPPAITTQIKTTPSKPLQITTSGAPQSSSSFLSPSSNGLITTSSHFSLTTTSHPKTHDSDCREFLLLFSRHDSTSLSDNITLLVTASDKGHLSIYNPQNGSYENITLQEGSNVVNLDPEIAVLPMSVERKGIHVTSDVDVTIHVMQYRNVADTGYLALPVGTLSKYYVVPTYYSAGTRDPSQITVGALHNNTNISFQISLRSRHNLTFNGTQYKSGDVINITLNEFETFQLISDGDISGTVVSADKKIAVLSGTMFTMVPFNAQTFDAQTLEQMIPPTSYLGTKYIVPSLMGREHYNVRIVSVYSNTTVNISGSQIHLQRIGDYREGVFGISPTVVTSDKPILVVQYAQTQRTQNDKSSGAMIIIPSTKTYQNEYNFTIPDPPKRPLQTNYKHYISMIIPGNNTQNVRIDDKAYTMYNSTVRSIQTPSGETYKVVNAQVDPGFHSVSSPVKIGLIANGRDYGQGYGFPVNMQCPVQ